MNANEIANAGIVTQLAVVHTMLPKVKELIDQLQAENEALKKEIGMMNKCLKQANDMWVGAMKQIETYEKRMFG